MVRRAVTGLALAIGILATSPAVAPAAGPGGWDHLGSGLNSSVNALNTDQPGVLLVGGTFTDAGGNSNADYIASWNGSSWSALGPGSSLNTAVNAIAYAGGRVIAGGTFTNAAGNSGADYLAAWDGVSWQPFCASNLSGPVLSLEVIGPTLYVGGSFLNVNGDPVADQLIRCDAGTGAYLGPTVDADADLDGGVQALVADASGNLYAGGTFINMDGIPQADYVARYNGSSWSAMGSGSGAGMGAIDTANVDSLATDGTNVYVGTDADDIAGIPNADHVARWNGSSWSALAGEGFFPTPTAINGLLVSGSNVYATGSFLNAGGNAMADHVAVFNGSSWSNVGSDGAGNGPFIGQGNALATFAGSTIVGGGFTNAGGDPDADRIAAYGAAGPPPGGSAPTASIKKGPKGQIKTKKPKAKVKFTFAAPEAASFLCSLDGKKFTVCSSPKTYKVKPGKHVFAVEAVNAAGVIGAPDKQKFKVVRKR